MTIKNQTIIGSAEYGGAPTITPIDRFIASNATQPGKPVYNIKTIIP